MEDQDQDPGPRPGPVLQDQVPGPRPGLVLQDQDPGPRPGLVLQDQDPGPRPVLQGQVPGPGPVLQDQDPRPGPVLQDQDPGPVLEDKDPRPGPVLEDQDPRPGPVLEDQDPGPRPVLEDQVPGPEPRLVREDQVPGPEPRLVLEDQVPGPEPRLVLVFSGKRKSGKDYVTDMIQSRLGPARCVVLRLSAPLKAQYAREAGLDLDLLLGPGPYKERFRSDMIAWGERRRARDPGFFCRLATSGARQPVWVVGDARRPSDLRWFQERFPRQTRLVRVQSCQETRRQRGWSFTPGVDDAESECGLDHGVQFDWTITNQADAPPLDQQLEPLLQLAKAAADQSETGQSETTG